MRKFYNNLALKYLLVLSISIALALAQTGKMHKHLVHDDHSGSSAHVLDVHLESTLHDFELTNHHHGYNNDHSTAAVDVSLDKLLKSTNFLNPLVATLLLIGLLLRIPRRTGMCRQRFDKTLFPPCYYLFQPPLRAPPVK